MSWEIRVGYYNSCSKYEPPFVMFFNWFVESENKWYSHHFFLQFTALGKWGNSNVFNGSKNVSAIQMLGFVWLETGGKSVKLHKPCNGHLLRLIWDQTVLTGSQASLLEHWAAIFLLFMEVLMMKMMKSKWHPMCSEQFFLCWIFICT